MDRNEEVWKSIMDWEEHYFQILNQSGYRSLEFTFNEAIGTWKPKEQKKLLKLFDTVIFHTQMIVQNSKYEKETTEKILDLGRVFNPTIKTIEDMQTLPIDQLRYIANQLLAKHRLISLFQGGMSGLGGILLLATDLPLMLTMNLRSIQLIAKTYGFDLSKPYELMIALKVFHVATLPKSLQKEGWEQLFIQLDDYEDEWLVFDEENSYRSTSWLIQPIKQLAKGIAIMLVRKKMMQGIPVFGVSIGAASNYYLAKQVSEIAHHFYQKRYLMTKV